MKLLVGLGGATIRGAGIVDSICSATDGGIRGRHVGTFGDRTASGVGDGIWIHCVNVY